MRSGERWQLGCAVVAAHTARTRRENTRACTRGETHRHTEKHTHVVIMVSGSPCKLGAEPALVALLRAGLAQDVSRALLP